MKYEDILKSHLKYGSTKEDIVKRNEYENILESVVIAPWWDHNIFENSNVKIDKVNDKIYNIYGENLEFSFIELNVCFNFNVYGSNATTGRFLNSVIIYGLS